MQTSGRSGRSTSFEVVVDGQYLAYSKLQRKTFPDYESLADEVHDYAVDAAKVPSSWSKVQEKQ